MTRSKRRKLQRAALARPAPTRQQATVVIRPRLIARRSARLMPLAPLLLAGYAHAQQSSGGLDEIFVTAQKREESLQDVPVSVQALGSARLDQLQITNFDQYTQFLPSVSVVNARPGFAQVYFRGVASAGDADANHSGSLPLVGTYLDEQPITTIQGALDVHLYDVARVEALAGPQGTLYGASSEAGTIKIVTNKPNTDEFSAAYSVQGTTLTGGGDGYLGEGYVNVPLSDNMAVRAVGWVRKDPGFIDNVRTQRTFPSTEVAPRTPITTDNAASVEDNYNEVDTVGARAALRIDLNDSWTVTPSVMAQEQKADGSFGYDRTLGQYKLSHAFPEDSKDSWVQAALTVEGKIGNFDMVYAGSYLDRDVDLNFDYSDYSYWYDVSYLADGYYFSDYFTNDDGDPIDFSQFVFAFDRYEKQSHEIRISSPQDNRLRGIAGLFYQRQKHDIEQNYQINDLTADLEVTGREDTIWLTKQDRLDEDYAVFGELYYDITEKLTATVGARAFKAENSLIGYFGFSEGFSTSGNSGEVLCDNKFGDGPDGPNSGADLPDYQGAPCKNLDDKTKDDDVIYKGSLSYKITDDKLIYATYSEGFRPGGINRRGTVPPYQPDQLNNYEIGWKTSWLDDRLRINGAVFHQEWKDFQYSILGPNGLTEVGNAGDADIDGIEMDVGWAVTSQLGVSAGVAFLDSELTEPYCAQLGPDGGRVNQDPCPFDDDGDVGFEPAAAPEGTKLPVSPDFKANLTTRYQFMLGSLGAHVQGALVYVGERESDLRTFENSIVGTLPSYTLVDFSMGVKEGDWAVEFFVSNAFNEEAEFSRFAQCPEGTCGEQTYSIVAPPRLLGVKFSQEF